MTKMTDKLIDWAWIIFDYSQREDCPDTKIDMIIRFKEYDYDNKRDFEFSEIQESDWEVVWDHLREQYDEADDYGNCECCMKVLTPNVHIECLQHKDESEMTLCSTCWNDQREELEQAGWRNTDEEYDSDEADGLCVLCKNDINDPYGGHNPAPLKEYGKCCEPCNTTLVVPMRVFLAMK